MSIFDTFERKHDYLVCVDSDGCVMDTMNCKHFHCFGPCMVTEWDLEEWKEEILDRWILPRAKSCFCDQGIAGQGGNCGRNPG